MMFYADKVHPVLVCSTCGLATKKFHVRHSDTLRQEKRKTWKRIIKPSNTKTTTVYSKLCGSKRIVRQKMIYVSYVLMDCLRKKHKMTVRKAPFSSSIVLIMK